MTQTVLRHVNGSMLEKLQQVSDAGNQVSAIREVATLVESLVGNLRAELDAATASISGELKILVQLIELSKRDLGTLNGAAVGSEDLPGAADQLDAVVQHTEEAAGQIMDCADELSALAGELDEPFATRANGIAMRIFEASSFQDITGQRVTKVVKLLKTLEQRLGKLIDTTQVSTVVPQDSRPDAHLLNGPQLPASASNQTDIDALFDSL